jgi:hypothetical protein
MSFYFLFKRLPSDELGQPLGAFSVIPYYAPSTALRFCPDSARFAKDIIAQKRDLLRYLVNELAVTYLTTLKSQEEQKIHTKTEPSPLPPIS